MDFGALLHYAKKKNDAATKEDEVRIARRELTDCGFIIVV